MKIEVDKDADAAYIYFTEINEGDVVETVSLNKYLNIDVDKEGKTLGIEILDISKQVSKDFLSSVKIKNITSEED
jgi:uncharacterized protein YuzE